MQEYVIGISGWRGLSHTGFLSQDKQKFIGDTLFGFIDNHIGPGKRVRVLTGGCVGVDAFVAAWCKIQLDEPRYIIVETIVPANPKLLDPLWLLHCHEYKMLPPGCTYKDRNQIIADRCGTLLAFPFAPEDHPESHRSGTWQTIRMARKLEKEALVHPLWKI